MAKKKEEKKAMGILIPVETYREFRIHCIAVDRRPGELLTEIMMKALKKESQKLKQKR